MHKITDAITAITAGVVAVLFVVILACAVIVAALEGLFRRFLFALVLTVILCSGAWGQLISQGNEQQIIYSGYTAVLATNTPASNFAQTTGTNTFILNATPSNAVRVYLTNDTANACNAFQITIATTAEQQLNSFNQNLQAWQIVPAINPVTGTFATNTGALSLPGNSTVVITSAAIAGNKIAVIVNNTSGGCATTSVDVVAVFTPIAITSPLISVGGNGAITPGNIANVQGIASAGSNASAINPVLGGDIGQPVNTGINTAGVDNVSASSIIVPNGTTGTVTTGFAPAPSKAGEVGLAFDAHSSSLAGTNIPAPPWSCIGGACGGGSPQLSLSVLNNITAGQVYQRIYSSSTGGPNNDILIAVDMAASPAGVQPSVRLTALGTITFSLGTTLAGSTTMVAIACQTTLCTTPSVTDTQGLTYAKVASLSIAPAGGSSPNWTGLNLFISTTTTSAANDTITCAVGTGTIGGCLAAEVINISPAGLTFPLVAPSADSIGAQVVRLDAGAPNQFDCNVTISTNTTTQCQAAPTTINGVPVRLYITDEQINTTTAGTATTIQLVDGTGVNCATGVANLSAIAVPNVATGLTSFLGMRTPLIAPQGAAVCVKQAGTTPGTSVVEVHGFLAP